MLMGALRAASCGPQANDHAAVMSESLTIAAGLWS